MDDLKYPYNKKIKTIGAHSRIKRQREREKGIEKRLGI
jgi:hypothetical protein